MDHETVASWSSSTVLGNKNLSEHKTAMEKKTIAAI
jgi:hypothetical protein